MAWTIISVVGTDNQFNTPLRTTHVYPVDDLVEHLWSQLCPCRPKRDHVEPNLMIHNAFDGRERYETIREQ